MRHLFLIEAIGIHDEGLGEEFWSIVCVLILRLTGSDRRPEIVNLDELIGISWLKKLAV
jgi:hypothetical protein